MASAWIAVMRTWLSRSARCACSCASWEFRCENWRDLTWAGVVAVERREEEGLLCGGICSDLRHSATRFVMYRNFNPD